MKSCKLAGPASLASILRSILWSCCVVSWAISIISHNRSRRKKWPSLLFHFLLNELRERRDLSLSKHWLFFLLLRRTVSTENLMYIKEDLIIPHVSNIHSFQIQLACTLLLTMKGAQNKALNDCWCNIKLSLCLTREYKATWKENLAIYLNSLEALFQVPLQV